MIGWLTLGLVLANRIISWFLVLFNLVNWIYMGGWLSVVEVVEIFLEKLRELELVRKRRKEEEEEE